MNNLRDIDDNIPGVYMVRQLRHCYPGRYDQKMHIERVFLYDVVKVGRSRNLKRRLQAYIDVGFTKHDIVYCYSDSEEASIADERALKAIMHANPDAYNYQGNEWFRIEHAGATTDTRPAMGLTLLADLFEQMRESHYFISEEILEHCVVYGAPFPGLMVTSHSLYKRIAHDSLINKVPTDIDQLEQEYKTCHTMNPRITGKYSEVMFEKILSSLSQDDLIWQTEDGSYCHWMANDMYENAGHDLDVYYGYTGYAPIKYNTPDIQRHKRLWGMYGDMYEKRIQDYIANMTDEQRLEERAYTGRSLIL